MEGRENKETRWRGADEMLKVEREAEASSEEAGVGRGEEDEDVEERGRADRRRGRTPAQTHGLDVDFSRSDGATPVMLAVRDVDLFEGVAERLPWQQRPADLDPLGRAANLQPRDHRGRSAFHYAAVIHSPLKDEVVHVTAEALSHTDIASVSPLAFDKSSDSEFEDSDIELDTDGLYPDQQTAASRLQTPTHQRRFLTGVAQDSWLAAEEEQVAHGKCWSHQTSSFHPSIRNVSDEKKKGPKDSQPDTEIPPGFRNAMETLRDIRQAHQDAERGSSRGGSSLPSLRDNKGRRWSHVDPAPSWVFPRSSCLPVPPINRQRTQSDAAASQPRPGPLPVAEPSQLSQSAPSVMEPLLSSSVVTQARTHIQTRLSPHNAGHEHKTASYPRTPRLLAPLRPRDSTAPPVIKHHVPLKPISKSPLSSRTRIGTARLSWGSRHTGSHVTKGGSEESGSSSSSSSSQSSMDLEAEDVGEEDQKQKHERMSENGHLKLTGDRLLQEEIKLHCGAQSKNGHIPPIHRSTANVDVKPITHTSDLLCNNHSILEPRDVKLDDIKDDNSPAALGPEKQNTNMGSTTEPDAEINHEKTCKFQNELNHVKQTEDALCYKAAKVHKQVSDNVESATLKNSKPVGPQTLLTSVAHVDPRKGGKFSKPAQNKERGNGAHTQTNQSFNVLAHRGIISQSKSKSSVKCSSASTQVKDKVKVKSVHCTTGILSPRKKVLYHPQSKKENPEKLRAQLHTTVKGLSSVQKLQNQLTAGGTPRSKSAVDFIAYNDMFQQIQSGNEGPAIYEMFAGPVYENLRVSSTCEQTHRQVQSSMSRKTPRQTHKVKHRPLKQPQCKLRKSPGETMVVPPKTKHASPRTKPPVAPRTKKGSFKKENTPKLEAELVLSKQASNDDRENTEGHILYTIDEALSKHGSETVKPHDKTPTRPITEQLEASGNGSSEILQGTPQSHIKQLKINTWTSSSGNATRSPVYQRFLDEVGDGPLTDDLLQCLAEELISLDETGGTVGPSSDHLQSSKQTMNKGGSCQDVVSEVDAADSVARLGSGLDVDKTITWKKGEVLGRGAYGTVYCGLTSQGQLIAVKQVCLDTSDPDAAKREYNRLQEEVDLLKTLRHANIVGFLGTSLYQHVVSIFMEYVPGGSIASILHRFGPLPERVLALYTHQIVEGVAYLHLNRVIHRDLKGNNVMLMPTGVIKLIDFGCARRLRSLNHTASSSGDLLKSVHGTPYWMAPEVISETGYGRKSDIWSVGCTVFEMATGKPPLAHMDKLAAMFYIGARRGLMPSLSDEFSENAQEFVKICLTSDQRLRPSADDLLKHSFISKQESAVDPWEKGRKTCCSHSGLCR